ncbi:glutamyl-tRNA reductase [candidate division GN15 bacterium]|nr:glutamyl-tRNA reductase [candidate division GN15 bacterium]
MAAAPWYLYVCGVNHKNTSLDLRQPLQIGREELADCQVAFSELPGVMESAIVSTCNRIEFCFVADRLNDPRDIVTDFYRRVRGLDVSAQRDRFYLMRDREAAEHVFRVAAGVDSMVVGETQILGQLKDAYSSACTVKTAGRILHRLFHQAFRVGKQVRTDTEMGKGACSVASAAVEYVKSRLEQFDRPDILFIGASQMIALSASSLSRLDVGEFYFANRTVDKADGLAGRFGRRGHSLDDLPYLLPMADIVISCTGAPAAVLSAETVANAVAQREARPLLAIDLAVPRDIEPPESPIENLETVDLDSIKAFVETNRQYREAAVPQAEMIIEQRLDEFFYWYTHAHQELANGMLDKSFEHIRRLELERVMKKLPIELRDELDHASRHLVQKLLQVRKRVNETEPE